MNGITPRKGLALDEKRRLEKIERSYFNYLKEKKIKEGKYHFSLLLFD